MTQDLFDLFEGGAHIDAVASVGVLAWLDYPYVVGYDLLLFFHSVFLRALRLLRHLLAFKAMLCRLGGDLVVEAQWSLNFTLPLKAYLWRCREGPTFPWILLIVIAADRRHSRLLFLMARRRIHCSGLGRGCLSLSGPDRWQPRRLVDR